MIKWWNESALGLMIHFGTYALYGGEYKGKKTVNSSEWIQSELEIPNKEYAEIAKTFNPCEFSGDEWIKRAKDCGIDYIVFTSKHHEGFANFKSEVSDFNLWNYQKKDLVKELGEACRKYGVKFGIYYSHSLDWHEPNSGGTSIYPPITLGMKCCNTWDYPDNDGSDFKTYYENKALAQVRELLTNYGKVDIMWFDYASNVTYELGKKLYDLVKSLQPDCLINSRICEGAREFSDFFGLGDNAIGGAISDDRRESIITLNESWGYNKFDKEWKTWEKVVKNLAVCAGSNSNLMVNIGPKPNGKWQEETVEIWEKVGKWMKVNSESVKCVKPVPVPKCDDYVLTQKDNCVYVIPFAEKIEISHLKSKVEKAENLKGENVLFTQDESVKFTVQPYEAVKLTCKEKPVFSDGICEVNNKVLLEMSRGNIDSENIRINERGVAADWTNTADSVSWKFSAHSENIFDVYVVTSCDFKEKWLGGNICEVCINDNIIKATLKKDITMDNNVYETVKSFIGSVTLKKDNKLILKNLSDTPLMCSCVELIKK